MVFLVSIAVHDPSRKQVTHTINRLLDIFKVIIVFVIPGVLACGMLIACIYALFFYQMPMG